MRPMPPPPPPPTGSSLSPLAPFCAGVPPAPPLPPLPLSPVHTCPSATSVERFPFSAAPLTLHEPPPPLAKMPPFAPTVTVGASSRIPPPAPPPSPFPHG